MYDVTIDPTADVKTTDIGAGTVIGRHGLVADEVKIGSHCAISPYVHIHDNVVVGDNVTIGENVVIYSNVRIRAGTFVGPGCVLGERLHAFYQDPADYHNPILTIGRHCIVRSQSVIYAGSVIGDHFQTGHHAIIREESKIGHHCSLGSSADIQGCVEIGDYCRFHSAVHIGQLSVIKNYVFMFPNSVLTNDPHPPSDTCTRGPTLEDYCVISAGAVLMPGITVGKDSVVGANSLVTKNVEPEKVVLGVPARPICSIHDIRCKEGKLEKPYPWREHFSRGMPWESAE